MSLKRNVVANYLGQGWAAAMGLAFVPLYLRALGLEAYGLIGVFTILQAAVALLDLGLTPTLTRELARLRAGVRTAQSIRDLLRSVEQLYLALTCAMVLAVFLAASWMAVTWLQVKGLDQGVVINAIRVMGFVLATRWMEQVFRGALQGLQDMVWLNTLQAALATLRWGGAYLVLRWIAPSITLFFAWQGAVSLLTVLLLVQRTYRLLPVAQRSGRFSMAALLEIRIFAGGMFAASLLGFALMQADKIVISKMLPLAQLGYYTLAATAAAGLLQLIMPMNSAVFPRLTEHVAAQASAALRQTYLQACQWMSAVIIAPALMLVVFAESVLLLWTGDRALSHSAAPLLALLALGTLFNGLMNLPYMLQLAHGWIGLSLKINLVAVALVLPLLIWSVSRYGAVGAAGVWVALNAAYIILGVHLMHARLLPESKWRWYLDAVLGPLSAGATVAVVSRLCLGEPSTRGAATKLIAGVSAAVLLAVWSALPAVRQTLIRRTLRRFARLPSS